MQQFGAAAAGSKPLQTASACNGLHPEARDQTAALFGGELTAAEQPTEGEQSCGIVTAGPMLLGIALQLQHADLCGLRC